MALIEKHIVPKGTKSQYLNTYAPLVFEYLSSKSKTKLALKEGTLLVNGDRVLEDYILKAGDRLELKSIQSKKPKTKIKRFDLEVEVVFEDEHIAAVNKPSGIPVNGNQLKTLENCLGGNIQKSKEKDALDYPAPLHRLDEPTSGIVLVAKTHRAQVSMGKLFESKGIQKRYKAIVIGELKGEGEVDTPIANKPSKTLYKVINSIPSKVYDAVTLMDLYPVTGRTHQLRIHMSSLQHPIVGDKYYSEGFKVFDEKGLFLCSDQVIFMHPITKEKIEINIELPNKFTRYMGRESKVQKSNPKRNFTRNKNSKPRRNHR